jgi:hypothetical protein
MNLQEIVLEKGFNTLLKRMETILDSATLKRISEEVVVSAEITDLEKVKNTISQIWPGLNIKDIRIDIRSQSVKFRLWGECWVPKKYSSFILFKDNYSLEKTEECDYHHVIKEEYADQYSLPLNLFNEGIKMEIV